MNVFWVNEKSKPFCHITFASLFHFVRKKNDMIKRLLLLFCFSIYVLMSNAQNLDELADTIDIQDIVITHSKFPMKASLTAKPIQTIPNKVLKLSTGKDLSQVLNEQTGINVVGALSNRGKDKSVFVRGASGEYTVILIDGQPILDPSGIGGVVDLRLFHLDNIERIEVLKGSQSTLYGSDAIAGVINIITEKVDNDGINLTGKFDYGSYKTLDANIGVSGKSGLLRYNLNVGRSRSDGISEALSSDPSVNFNEDGFSLNSVNARFDLKVNEAISIKPYFQYSDYNSDTDDGSFADADNQYRIEFVNVGAILGYDKNNLSGQLSYTHSSTDRVFDSSFGISEFFGRFNTLESWGNYRFNERVQVTGGLNYQNHGMLDNTTTIPDPSETIVSPYVSFLLHPLENLNIEAGFRYNDHSKFGSNSNFSTAVSYWVNSKVKAFTNFSTGFKAPNLFQLYGAFGANPNLLPQRSATFEIGLQASSEKSIVNPQITYFRRRVKDVVVYSFVPGYFNRDEQNDYGVEIDLGFSLSEDFIFKAQYTYLNGEVTTLDDMEQEVVRNNLYRRPKHNIGLSAFYSGIDNLNITGRLNSIGDRTDLFFNPDNLFTAEEVLLNGYFYMSAHIQYNFSKTLSAFLDMKNLTDTQFQEVYGFSTQGTNYIMGIQLKL